MINPDLIQDGDQVTIENRAGAASTWTVRSHAGPSLQLVSPTEVKVLRIGGRRSAYQIVGHQPRLV